VNSGHNLRKYPTALLLQMNVKAIIIAILQTMALHYLKILYTLHDIDIDITWITVTKRVKCGACPLSRSSNCFCTNVLIRFILAEFSGVGLLSRSFIDVSIMCFLALRLLSILFRSLFTAAPTAPTTRKLRWPSLLILRTSPGCCCCCGGGCGCCWGCLSENGRDGDGVMEGV
jgi:hypothetical protein